MKIKEEYVAFAMCNYCNGTGAYLNIIKNNKGDYTMRDGYYYISYNHRFPTKEKAEEVLKSAYKRDINEIVFVNDVIEARSLSVKNKGMTIFCIMQVPKSYYIGEVWEATLELIGETCYTDEKPSVVYRSLYRNLRSYNAYLKRVDGQPDEWVEDIFDATFFTTKDANKIADEFCKRKHNHQKDAFYAWSKTLLIRPDEGMKPELEKGDEVYVLNFEHWPYSNCCRGRKYTIEDIKVGFDKNGDKEFLYYVCDTFAPRSCFKTRQEILNEGGRFYRDYFNGRIEDLVDYRGRTFTAY